jgi:DNA-binding CsgD family transcriptional regulator
VDAAGVQDRIVLHRFLQERRRAKGPLVLVTERTLLKNAAADRLIEPADEPALRERALKIVHEADNVLVLHRGTVTARVEPILDGRTHIGAVLHLKPQPSPAEGKRRSGAGRPTFGWDSLTGTEESITELVAQGLTNRQTAERLFLSRHTVDSHLRSIFRKLDVSSRVGLARLAAEHDTGDRAIAG